MYKELMIKILLSIAIAGGFYSAHGLFKKIYYFIRGKLKMNIFDVEDDGVEGEFEAALAAANAKEGRASRALITSGSAEILPVHGPVHGVDHMVYKNNNNQEAEPELIAVINNEQGMLDALKDLMFFMSTEQEENLKWEVINGDYCRLTCGKPKNKAEVIRTYFRKLDQNFRRKDGSIYSRVVNGKEAKKIIEKLIEVYPWDNPNIKSQSQPKVDRASEERRSEVAELKESVNEICYVISEIQKRLEKIS